MILQADWHETLSKKTNHLNYTFCASKKGRKTEAKILILSLYLFLVYVQQLPAIDLR